MLARACKQAFEMEKEAKATATVVKDPAVDIERSMTLTREHSRAYTHAHALTRMHSRAHVLEAVARGCAYAHVRGHHHNQCASSDLSILLHIQAR